MNRNILLLANTAVKKMNVYKSAQAFKLMSGLTQTNRYLHTIHANSNDAEATKCMELYRKIVDEIKMSDENGVFDEVNQWFTKALDYNVLPSKMSRGMALIDTYTILNSDRIIDSNTMEKVRILGWSVEFMQAFVLIFDDIMDNSPFRRGQQSWYSKADVGMTAIKDALMIENTCYYLLGKHFGNEQYYPELNNLILDIYRKTIYGQCLDMLSFHAGVDSKPDLSKYTMERNSIIAKYKTAYYSFCLPIQLAMHISGINDHKSHAIAERILLKMGVYFQAKNDFLDCFGDPKVIGKVGTDIEEGKCCWPVVTALKRANREQYKVLEDNYAVNNSVAIEKVKRLYREMNIENEFNSFAEKCYTEIRNDIESIDKSTKLSTVIFSSLLEKLHKSQK